MNQGALINRDALDKIERLVADARAKGVEVLVGGERHEFGGTFYLPSMIVDATMATDSAQEEIFGPVAMIYKFKDESEAVALANGAPDGRMTTRLTRQAMDDGQIILSCGVSGNVIRFLMPLNISDTLLDEGMRRLEASLSKVSGAA